LYPKTADKDNGLQENANEEKQRMMGSAYSTHVLFRAAMSSKRNVAIKMLIPAGFYLLKATK